MTALACDIGGSRLKIGIVRDGHVLARTIEPAHSDKGLALRLPVLKQAWLRQLDQLGLRLTDCAGVSVSFPSLVDPASARILAEYGKFGDAPDLDLRAWALQELGLPLAIENDARMALIGEWRHGAGRGVENLVMITLGTGLGTSAIIEGRLLRGQHGQAGVLGGHLSVNSSGRPCSCGNIGCAEAEASTAYLDQMIADAPEAEKRRLTAGGSLSYWTVFEQAAAGNDFALALRNHSLRVWSTLAVNLIHAYDPELVIVGGGIMVSGEVILPAVREHVARYAHTPWGKVEVVASELGAEAALVAAEWLLQESPAGRACTE